MRRLREFVLGSVCLLAAMQTIPAQAVENYQVDLVDSARGNRKVGVNIFIPENASEALPTMILSHGFGESYHSYDYLGEGLAKRGYVVVVVNHIGSDVAALGAQRTSNLQNPDNLVVRPQDVSFVLDRLLEGDSRLGNVVGKVDAERVAMAGHSLGSTTALEIAGATVLLGDGKPSSFADPRFRAVIAMSPQLGGASRARSVGVHPGTWQTVKVPALVMWGTEDRGFGALSGDPSLRMEVYEKVASAEKYAVVIEGAEHHAFTETDPWYPGGTRDPRHHEWIIGIVSAFLNKTLVGTSNDALLHPKFPDARPGEIVVTSSQGGSAGGTAGAAAAGAGAATRAAPGERDPAALRQLLDDAARTYRLSGAAMLVADRSGEIVFEWSSGSLDPDSKVPIASASKWFAASTVMRLVDRGLVALDDPVSKYLPDFKGGDRSKITLRQSMAFTSGLPAHIQEQDDPSLTKSDLVKRIASVPLEGPPGEAFRYGGLQMELAGAVAEVVTGKGYRELLREEVSEPLGLEDTDIGNMRNRRPQDIVFETRNPLVPGGVVTTARENLQLALMLLNKGATPDGKRILSEQSVSEMLRDQTGGVPIVRTVQPDNTYRYGLGGWVHPVEGGVQISSEGGLGTTPWIDPQRGYAAVFVTVTRGDALATFRPQLKATTDAFWDGTSVAAAPLAEPPPRTAQSRSSQRGARAGGGGGGRLLDDPAAMAQVFERMDRDGNGRLSESEAPPRLAQAFGRLDANGDGGLSLEEIQALSALAGRAAAAGAGGASGGAPTSRQNLPTTPVTENVAEALGGQTIEIDDAARDRTITLDVYAPASPSSAPALIISEYAGGVRQAYGDLARHWADEGFVVLVPDHVDSPNEGGQRGTFARQHWPDRVADMAFLADHLDEVAKLAGLSSDAIARDKVGLVGHYIGAFAASVAAGARPPSGADVEQLAPGRVGALLLLSPQGPDEGAMDSDAWAGLKAPMMVVTGAGDVSQRTGQGAEWRAEVYKRSPPPDKYLAWFDALDSKYGGLFTPEGGSVTATTLAQDLTEVTTAFLSAYLQGEKDALMLKALVGEHEGYHIESK